MNFLKEHNVFLKILSLLIAIFLWSFVLLSENPIKTQTFSNQTVQEIGTEALAERGLMMVNTEQAKITLKVTGTSKDMANLTASDIVAQVDLSNIQEAGVYYIQPGITVQKTIDSVSFQPRRLQITIENVITKEVPVQVTTMNTLGENQLIDDLSPSQEKIQITGAESVVNTVDHALLTVDLENITKNKAQTCRVALYTEEDALVDSEFVKPEVETLDVTVGLNQVKSVKLNIDIVSSETLSSDLVAVNIAPEQVRVYGKEDALSQLNSINLGSINLAEVGADGEEHTFAIKLPEGVKLMEGEPKQARVKLSMKDGVSRILTVTNISLEDTSQEDEKEVYLESSSLDVNVEGKANVMANIKPENLHVSVKVDSSTLELGTQEVPCQISCDIAGVKILNQNQTIKVIVMQKEEEGS